MKINKYAKLIGIAGLVLTVAVGCASSPNGAQSAEAAQQSAKAQAEAAIAAAKQAIAKAKAENYLWRDTGKILKEAEDAFAKGDYAKATELANKARQQAEDAYAQGEREKAKAQTKVAPDMYTVNRGDSLWKIAGKSDIYGNPYEWPLIYKANQGKIKDADLIYPGQEFSIERGASAADITAAVNHAKTRGAWSLGKVEASDKAYLAK